MRSGFIEGEAHRLAGGTLSGLTQVDGDTWTATRRLRRKAGSLCCTAQVLRCAVIGLESREGEVARACDKPRKPDGLLSRRHAAAARADVDFHEDGPLDYILGMGRGDFGGIDAAGAGAVGVGDRRGAVRVWRGGGGGGVLPPTSPVVSYPPRGVVRFLCLVVVFVFVLLVVLF